MAPTIVPPVHATKLVQNGHVDDKEANSKPLAEARNEAKGGGGAALHPSVSARTQNEVSSGTSTFGRIMGLLKANPDLINLGLGAPDFEGCDVARQTAAQVLTCRTTPADVAAFRGLNQYSASIGLPRLRAALSSFYQRRYNATYNPDKEIIVTAGGTEAIYDIFSSFLNPGDKVVVYQPAWPWYFPGIRLVGGVPIPLDLTAPDFKIDLHELRNVFETEAPKMLILNTPHNPTGHALTRGELEGVAELCCKHGVLVLADEVYEHATFSHCEHLRIADFPGMWERTLTVGSGGKMYGLTGWRVGWVTGPAHLIRPIDVTHQQVTVCAPVPFQYGIAAALEAEDGSFGDVGELFEGNYKILKAALETIPGVRVCPADGGYFCTADASGRGMTGHEFAAFLSEKALVGVIPMSAFFANTSVPRSLVRVSICRAREQITLAAKRIRSIV